MDNFTECAAEINKTLKQFIEKKFLVKNKNIDNSDGRKELINFLKENKVSNERLYKYLDFQESEVNPKELFLTSTLLLVKEINNISENKEDFFTKFFERMVYDYYRTFKEIKRKKKQNQIYSELVERAYQDIYFILKYLRNHSKNFSGLESSFEGFNIEFKRVSLLNSLDSYKFTFNPQFTFKEIDKKNVVSTKDEYSGINYGIISQDKYTFLMNLDIERFSKK